MKKMRYTKENSNIMHELGHLIMYTLYLVTQKNFNRDYFIKNVSEISVIENEDSFGRVTINKEILVDRFCAKLVYLSGVLFSLEYVFHPDMLWRFEFEERKQIRKNAIEVFCKFGGSEDLLWILKNIKGADINYISTYIYETKKIIQTLRKDKTIKRVVHQIYKGLQKEKSLNSEECYSIVKPYIPELKALGRQIYNPITKFRINAKAILF